MLLFCTAERPKSRHDLGIARPADNVKTAAISLGAALAPCGACKVTKVDIEAGSAALCNEAAQRFSVLMPREPLPEACVEAIDSAERDAYRAMEPASVSRAPLDEMTFAEATCAHDGRLHDATLTLDAPSKSRTRLDAGRLLALMPPQQRVAVEAHFDGAVTTSIAQPCKCKRDTARARFTRGMTTLRAVATRAVERAA